MSTYGWPVTSTCCAKPARRRSSAIRVSLEPATRWSSSTPTRRCGDGPNSRSASSRLSAPSSGSTTTPSTRRSSPQIRSTRAASCTPSTQIRLARATRAGAFGTATDPEAVRAARPLRGVPRPGRIRVTGRAVEQEGRGQHGKDPPLAVPVLEGHDVAPLPRVDCPPELDHRAAERAVGGLDDEVVLRREPPARYDAARVVRGRRVVAHPASLPGGTPRSAVATHPLERELASSDDRSSLRAARRVDDGVAAGSGRPGRGGGRGHRPRRAA